MRKYIEDLHYDIHQIQNINNLHVFNIVDDFEMLL